MTVRGHATPPHDPLFPSVGMLPLSDSGGVQNTLAHSPGRLRPFSATLGVPRPLVFKNHDTTGTKFDEPSSGDTSKDGVVLTDTIPDTKTDT